MRLPAVTLVGLAFLEVNAQHTDPEAKSLLEVIGRKLHQGDRMPRHRVETHTRRVVALDHAVRIMVCVRTMTKSVELLTAYSHTAQAADLGHCHTLALTSPVRAARPSTKRPWSLREHLDECDIAKLIT